MRLCSLRHSCTDWGERERGGLHNKVHAFHVKCPFKSGLPPVTLRHIVKDRTERSEKSVTAALCCVKSASGWSRRTLYRRASPTSMCSPWDRVCWWRVSVFLLCWNSAKCCEAARAAPCAALTYDRTRRHPGAGSTMLREEGAAAFAVNSQIKLCL